MKITYAGVENYLCRVAGGRWRDAGDVNAQLPWKNECAVCAGMSYIDWSFGKSSLKMAKRKSTRACEYVSRRLQMTLYICRRREIYVLWLRTAEKRSVASRVHLPVKHFAQLRALFSSFFPLFSLSFCKLTRFSGAFFRLFPRCLIRGQAMIHFCTSS